MKIDMTCPCGSQVTANYAPHDLGMNERERNAERNEARKLIDQWRTAHRPCLKRLDERPEFLEFKQGPELDAHDDETERRLLVRLEREELLVGSADDARRTLDA